MSGPNAFVTAMVCFFLGVGLATWIAYESHMEHAHESKAFALKQNGDTLFIPTQVVVRHDTIVVIKTEERIKWDTTGLMWGRKGDTIISGSESGNWITGNSMILSGTTSIQNSKGEWVPIPRGPRKYKQRDTIYEHKIIYY